MSRSLSACQCSVPLSVTRGSSRCSPTLTDRPAFAYCTPDQPAFLLSEIPYAEAFLPAPRSKFLTLSQYLCYLRRQSRRPPQAVAEAAAAPTAALAAVTAKRASGDADGATASVSTSRAPPAATVQRWLSARRTRGFAPYFFAEVPHPRCKLLERLLATAPAAVARMSTAQLAVGGAGTGAPLHFHKPAFNFCIAGRKWWCLLPPERAVWSNAHVLDFLQERQPPQSDHQPRQAAQSGGALLWTRQEAGDVLFVPAEWAHGVVNTPGAASPGGVCVAVAEEVEFIGSICPQSQARNHADGGSRPSLPAAAAARVAPAEVQERQYTAVSAPRQEQVVDVLYCLTLLHRQA